jgi:dihydrolipoamide dehydrogenase
MVMGEETLQTELLVIGGGSGGYAAAFRAAELGIEVTLVTDEEQLGGVCLNRGCIPAKALLQVVKLMNEAREAKEQGLTFNDPEVDLESLKEWKNSVVNQLTTGLESLSKRHEINVIQARATFEDSNKVRLQGADITHVEFDYAVIATGSQPLSLPDMDMKFETGSRIMDADIALALPDIPEKLLVVGGGYIGIEIGMVYASLGSQITLVEMMGELLPGKDRDLIKPLAKEAEERYAAIHLNTTVVSIEEDENGVTVELEGDVEETSQKFDRVLIAIGRKPSSQEIGLENTSVETDEDGFIIVDEELRTADKHIFAVGDVAGKPLLAHKATHQGLIAAEVIAEEPAAFDVRCVPAVVYTDPEVAWCGLLDGQAEEKGYQVKVARFPWKASGRALTLNSPGGLTKIVFDAETERVLGVGIVGRGAAELIGEAVLAVEMGAVAQDLALAIHPHPTLSETFSEAADVFLGKPLHIYK